MKDMPPTATSHDPSGSRECIVPLGGIASANGLKGWVSIRSDTSPADNIFRYTPWIVGHDVASTENGRRLIVQNHRWQGKKLLVLFEDITDRTAAEQLTGMTIAVLRQQLPQLPAGEYYWHDLIDLAVITSDGQALGRIQRLFETGANDVMVVQGTRERYIPFIQPQVVQRIDLTQGTMIVDWDADF